MKRKTLAGLTVAVAIVVAVMFAGCVEEGGEIAKPTGQVEKVTEEIKQTELLATAVSGSVMTMPKNWDADAEDDGIVVYPGLKGSSGETVEFEGVVLQVEVKIYTTKFTEEQGLPVPPEQADRLVYSGTATIDSWKDGNPFFSGGGIKVPFEDINTVPSDRDYGWVYTTITLPDGRTIEARDQFARIKPEVTEEINQTALLASAVSGSVMTRFGNWDADAEDDGIVVYPGLKGRSGETVEFEGVVLPVEVKIYTTKCTEEQGFPQPPKADRLVYSGTATIDSWKDGNPFFSGGGIKVPFEDINTVPSDSDYGWVYTTITLPDGRTIEARDQFARIKE